MLRSVIKAQMTGGFRNALRGLWSEFLILRRHRASLRKARRLPKTSDLKLNLGCGANLKPGWINVDSFNERADLQLDLREKFPFRDESVSFIYSEHFFEHLEYPDQAIGFLRKAWRVLKPGGTLSISVPDTEWPLISYATGNEEYFRLARERFHPKWCNTRMHNLNYHFRQGSEHKHAYDFETLGKILQEVGFVSMEKRPFKPGLDSEARRMPTLPGETVSLNVDAIKPHP